MTMPQGLAPEERAQWRNNKTSRERDQREVTLEAYDQWKAAQRLRSKLARQLAPEKIRAQHRARYNEGYNQAWKRANPERRMLAKTKEGARRRGIEFSLELSDIQIPDRCPVLGIPLVFGGRRPDGRCLDNAPSVDRIDNSRGYVRGNIVIISYRANLLKRDATKEELAALAVFYCK